MAAEKRKTSRCASIRSKRLLKRQNLTLIVKNSRNVLQNSVVALPLSKLALQPKSNRKKNSIASKTLFLQRVPLRKKVLFREAAQPISARWRSEEHTSELQSQ